jgi:hypothetical protein
VDELTKEKLNQLGVIRAITWQSLLILVSLLVLTATLYGGQEKRTKKSYGATGQKAQNAVREQVQVIHPRPGVARQSGFEKSTH